MLPKEYSNVVYKIDLPTTDMLPDNVKVLLTAEHESLKQQAKADAVENTVQLGQSPLLGYVATE